MAADTAEFHNRAMDPVRNPYSPGAGTPPPALVGRGLCYRPRDGVIDFTVPMFDEFVRRALTRARSKAPERGATRVRHTIGICYCALHLNKRRATHVDREPRAGRIP